MKQYLSSVRNHYLLNITVGIVLTIAGLMELLKQEEAEMLHTSHGIILLGMVYIIKATVELMEGFDQLFEGFDKKGKLPQRLKKLSHNFIFHFIIFMLLFILGSLEIIEELVDEKPGISEIWHFGVIGAGFMHLSAAVRDMAKAITFSKLNMDKKYNKWFLQFFKLLNFPKTELMIGIFIVTIVIWEELTNNTVVYDVHGHHALAFFAIVRILIVLSLSATSEALSIDGENK